MDSSSFSFEQVATLPAPGNVGPTSLGFSPDGGMLTFLASRDGSLNKQLYALDTADLTEQLFVSPPGSGDTEENLSQVGVMSLWEAYFENDMPLQEEKLRRERMRELSVGVTSYAWSGSDSAQLVLVPMQGNLFVQDKPGGELRQIFDKSSTGAQGGAVDPRMSRNGDLVAFVQDSELYVVRTDESSGGGATQITSGARGTSKTNGLADFIAMEEMDQVRSP
jgi:dipeptidyl-peptidase-4